MFAAGKTLSAIRQSHKNASGTAVPIESKRLKL